jgi:hypothetical protein
VAKRTKKKAAAPTSESFFDVEQGSPDWHTLRLGIPTSSVFATVNADPRGSAERSVTRDRLMRELAGEILTGEVAERFVSEAMKRGKEMEPEARQRYIRTIGFVETEQVGFVRRKLPSGRYVGCSPDLLVGDRKVAEFKTMRPDLMIEMLEKGASGFPPEHRTQCQGTLWLTERDEIDLVFFYRGMPVSPKFTTGRDEAFIKELSNAVEVFDHELNTLVKRIRAMGR